MKKQREYEPIYSDIIDELPDTTSDHEDQLHYDAFMRKVNKKRTGVIVFTIVIYVVSLVISSFATVEWCFGFLALVLIACLFYRFLYPGYPLHRDEFPSACIILTGVIVYFILTAGYKKYYANSEFNDYRAKR